MLASIPAWKFYEWEAFYELEPDEGYRADWGFAHVVQALMRDGKPLKDFALRFGDTPQPEKATQTLAMQQRLIDDWIFASNLILAKSQGKS